MVSYWVLYRTEARSPRRVLTQWPAQKGLPRPDSARGPSARSGRSRRPTRAATPRATLNAPQSSRRRGGQSSSLFCTAEEAALAVARLRQMQDLDQSRNS